MNVLTLKDRIYNRVVGHFIEKAIKRSTGMDVQINLKELQVTDHQDGSVTADLVGSVTLADKNELSKLATL